MSTDIDQSAIEEMRAMIEHFTERHIIVARVMLDVNPRAYFMNGCEQILGFDVLPFYERWAEKYNHGLAGDWQGGIWQNEWKYFAHGQGCLITHLVTGEVIEWDAPHLSIFDHTWFWNHLKWRLAQTTASDQIEHRLQRLKEVYDYMTDQKMILTNEYGNRRKLA